MNKLKVGVLMGGKSIEKEVSFNSGRTICDHLDTARYTVIPLFQHHTGALYILPWRFLHRGKISDFEQRLASQAERISWNSLKTRIDFMYIATHGRYAEDGTLQGFLEVLQIPYLGSKVMASALGMDKIVQKNILHTHGILVPQGITVTPDELTEYTTHPQKLAHVLQQEQLSLPCIIKPHKEGSSLGISVAYTLDELMVSITKAVFIEHTKTQSVVVEEYVTGMEFSCIILTDYKTGQKLPLPPTEVIPEKDSAFFDYHQKYMPGRATKFTPARCNSTVIEAIQQTCMRVMDILDIKNVARIDGFVTTDARIVITDPNTLSGMAPSSFLFRQAAELNMSHTQVINHLIETELAQYSMLSSLISQEQQSTNSLYQPKKLRVAVLLGGRSHEKEISLESGRNIFYKLSPQKYTPIAIFVDSQLQLHVIDQSLLVRNSTKEIELGLKPHMRIEWDDLATLADFVFIGLHGGEGENGCIQGTLEMLGIPYNGSSVFTSALCMDKFKANNYLRSQGFQVPQGILVPASDWSTDKQTTLQKINNTCSYPLIVKPHDDGCSVLVYKVHNDQQLITALEALFADKQFALIEECIMGMELTVGVIGNTTVTALPPSQAVCTGDILSIEEKFLPGAGENQTPAPLPEDTLIVVQQTMVAAYKALNCKGYARIDCFYQTADQSPTGNERVVLIEVNTLPGMTPATCIFHQAAEIGIQPMDFIDMIVKLGLEEHTAQVAFEQPAKEHEIFN
ncbi:ATP-grasp domain-containing protein [Candidatus Dependentiae bacterium]|nr:ATP-grasp domain-containing protein [Candidatus Dependentiae bacterium]